MTNIRRKSYYMYNIKANYKINGERPIGGRMADYQKNGRLTQKVEGGIIHFSVFYFNNYKAKIIKK